MRCEHCEADFTPKNSRGRFCSAKCRKAAWTQRREEREAHQRELIKTLARAAGLTAEDFA